MNLYWRGECIQMKDVTPKDKNKKFYQRNSKWLYAILVIAILVYYYMALPPIHYASIEFWLFIILILIGIALIQLLRSGVHLFSGEGSVKEQLKLASIPLKALLVLIPSIIVIWIVSSMIFSPFFMAKSYSEMLTITPGDFETEFPETDVNQIPLVDRETAIRLGSRRLGGLTDLVSQFVASEEYIQININNRPYRVTPLEYAGFFKWVNNFRQGIPHYLMVDNVTGEVIVKTPEQPIRYSYADKFQRDIMRHLRFNYPFTLFGKPNFEVDDQGTPYYIASTYGRNFFLFEPEVTGVITVNAMTGETTRYELDNIPNWIDRVYSSDLVLHQLEMNGKYKNGFWNTVFSNQGVTQPTQGYNYLPMNDDLYFYTGITSIVADESNIGFVLVNLRTKEAKMYEVNAAEEYSAMESAEGSVQEKGYTATFPMLINLNGRPLYILSLKDSSGLIKSYALVDVENYQTVYIETSVERLLLSYAQSNPIQIDAIETLEELHEVTGEVEQIQAVVKDGNTVYYFLMNGQVYQAPIQIDEMLPFIQNGDNVKLEVNDNFEIRGIESLD